MKYFLIFGSYNIAFEMIFFLNKFNIRIDQVKVLHIFLLIIIKNKTYTPVLINNVAIMFKWLKVLKPDKKLTYITKLTFLRQARLIAAYEK